MHFPCLGSHSRHLRQHFGSFSSRIGILLYVYDVVEFTGDFNKVVVIFISSIRSSDKPSAYIVPIETFARNGDVCTGVGI